MGKAKNDPNTESSKKQELVASSTLLQLGLLRLKMAKTGKT